MPSLVIGYDNNQMISHNVMFRHRDNFRLNVACHTMGGDGLGSLFKKGLSFGLNLFKKAKPRIQQATNIYNKGKNIAQKVGQVYNSDEGKMVRAMMPDSVKQKEQQIKNTINPYITKGKSIENQVKNIYNQVDNATQLLNTMVEPDKPKVAGQGLKNKLLKEYGGRGCCGKKGRGVRLAGDGVRLAGDGIALAGSGGNQREAMKDVIQLGMRMIPAIIQKGKGISEKNKQKLMKHSMEHYKKALKSKHMRGAGIMDIFKTIGSAIINPIGTIAGVLGGDGKMCGKGKNKKKVLLNHLQKHIENQLKSTYNKKMKGEGIDFGSILSTIGDVAGTVLPFLI